MDDDDIMMIDRDFTTKLKLQQIIFHFIFICLFAIIEISKNIAFCSCKYKNFIYKQNK